MKQSQIPSGERGQAAGVLRSDNLPSTGPLTQGDVEISRSRGLERNKEPRTTFNKTITWSAQHTTAKEERKYEPNIGGP
jgi:hypothetical protein